MINQKESKQVIMDSWLLKLLSRDMKTKQKKIKINQQTIKHEPLSQKWIDGRYRSLI